MMPYTPPTFKAEGFNCPLCNFFAHQNWHKVFYRNMDLEHSQLNIYDELELTECFKCKGKLLWYEERIVFPIVNGAPPSHPDMPKDVKKIYDEAKNIVSLSSRAAAA